MSDVFDELFAAARSVRERSYSPYSKYPVGAALRTTAGDTFVGCNVENAAYPEGTCAEAGAIAAMVAGSEVPVQIEHIVTITSGTTPGTPCGGCRQKIREFAAPDITIYACNAASDVVVMTMDQLLPDSFGPGNLAGIPGSNVP